MSDLVKHPNTYEGGFDAGYELASKHSADALEALQAERDRLREDADRLNYLDACNTNFNRQNGTRYGWKLDRNHNRWALTDSNFPPLTVREAIDVSRKNAPPNIRRALSKNDEVTGLLDEISTLRDALQQIASPPAMAMDSADRVEAFRDVARAALETPVPIPDQSPGNPGNGKERCQGDDT